MNRCKKLLQKQQTIILMETDDESFNETIKPFDGPSSFKQTEQHLDLTEMLAQLNPKQREAIELQYFHDLELQTIATMTHVPIGTVKSRISQGLKKCANNMEVIGMSEIDKQFETEKRRLEEVKAPEELQQRLRFALEQTPPRRKHKAPKWIAVAVALVVLSFVSYNYSAFAYYGKKLLGYDELMSDTLAQLNEEDSGQAIDKKVTLSDGTELYLDVLLTDENQSILYYTAKNSKGNLEDIQLSEIQGLWTKAFATYGTHSMNDEGTEMKGIQGFEAVNPFAKELTIDYMYNEGTEQGDITFAYNPKQAMQTELKQSIRKKVHVDQGTIRFDSITATPSRTTIKGKVNVDNYDRISLGESGVQLLANGKPVELKGDLENQLSLVSILKFTMTVCRRKSKR